MLDFMQLSVKEGAYSGLKFLVFPVFKIWWKFQGSVQGCLGSGVSEKYVCSTR